MSHVPRRDICLAVHCFDRRAAWSSPRWTPNLPFAFTRLPGPCMCPYNVLNDRTLALSAGCVHNKHQLVPGLIGPLAAGIDPECPECREQSEHHTPYAVVSTCGLLRCRSAAFAASRGYHTARFDIEHRLTLCRHLRSTDPCLFAIIREKVHGACMVGRV